MLPELRAAPSKVCGDLCDLLTIQNNPSSPANQSRGGVLAWACRIPHALRNWSLHQTCLYTKENKRKICQIRSWYLNQTRFLAVREHRRKQKLNNKIKMLGTWRVLCIILTTFMHAGSFNSRDTHQPQCWNHWQKQERSPETFHNS